MIIRSRALCEAGWFPLNSVTEDWALGMRLKKLNWRCRYVDVRSLTLINPVSYQRFMLSHHMVYASSPISQRRHGRHMQRTSPQKSCLPTMTSCIIACRSTS